MTNIPMDSFDKFLDSTLRRRTAGAPPAGLEQRLLAHLGNEPGVRNAAGIAIVAKVAASPARIFTTFDRVNTRRSSKSLWSAIAAHAAVFLIIFAVAAQRLRYTTHETAAVAMLSPLPPLAPTLSKMGGGGGQHGPTPVTAGHLPKLSQMQIVPPKAPPTLPPLLAVESSVVVQPNLKMADNKMPDMGSPESALKGFSMGNGKGSGLGSGDGNGIGPGTGGNTGGGPMHIGGAVLPPAVLFSVDPEFSEEARKAKFSGDVQVYLWVDEHGNPSHVQVVRGVGMGLDEKAVEAVRQYKFKPATKDGRPVKVDLYVNVNFQIF